MSSPSNANDDDFSPSAPNNRKRAFGTAMEGDHADDYDARTHRDLKALLGKRDIHGVKRDNNTKEAIKSLLRQDDVARRAAGAGDVAPEAEPTAATKIPTVMIWHKLFDEHGNTIKGRNEAEVEVPTTHDAMPVEAAVRTAFNHPVILPTWIHSDDVRRNKYPGVMMKYVEDGWYRCDGSDYHPSAVPYVSRAEFRAAVDCYRDGKDTPPWLREWLEHDKIQRGPGLFWWYHGQVAGVPENSLLMSWREMMMLSGRVEDVESLPKSVEAGTHSVTMQESLEIPINYYSAAPYLNVGMVNREFAVDKPTGLPEYVPRRSKNDLSKLAGNNTELLAMIDTPVIEDGEVEDDGDELEDNGDEMEIESV